MTIYVRPLTSEEAAEIERRAKSRTLPLRQVQRARIIQYSSQDWTPPTIAQELGINRSETVRCWIKRFNQEGLAGLEERPRAGRSRTYTEIERGRIIGLVLTNPKDLGLDFCHWTLDRIVEQVEALSIGMKRTQIYTVLRDEGIKWRKSRTWLKSNDPEFAEKRAEIIDLYQRRDL